MDPTPLHNKIGLDERGSCLTQYVLIVSLVAVMTIVTISFLGRQVETTFLDVSSTIGGTTNTEPPPPPPQTPPI